VNWVSGIVVYVIVWWLVLFCTLPLGIRPAQEGDVGRQSGAPANPRLWFKVMLTTAIASVLWGGIYLVIISDLISFRTP